MIELRRSMPTEFAVTGRTLEGLALRWDTPYRVSDDRGRTFYDEGWRRRALVESLAEMGNTFELRVDHADVRLGLVSFAESDEGLAFRSTVDGHELGDAALAEVVTGRTRGVSILYHPLRQKRDRDGVLWRLRARLRELSLTDNPQYHDAMVTAVRSHARPAVDAERAARVAAVLAWHPPEL